MDTLTLVIVLITVLAIGFILGCWLTKHKHGKYITEQITTGSQVNHIHNDDSFVRQIVTVNAVPLIYRSAPNNKFIIGYDAKLHYCQIELYTFVTTNGAVYAKCGVLAESPGGHILPYQEANSRINKIIGSIGIVHKCYPFIIHADEFPAKVLGKLLTIFEQIGHVCVCGFG